MKHIVVLENLRSCYNVGNIIRTADALGWDLVLVGYTPSPTTQPKVKKTSLGAEDSVNLKEFFTMDAALEFLKSQNYTVVAAEVTDTATDLDTFQQKKPALLAIVFGNEVIGVEEGTLSKVDAIVKIPMVGVKESLNVGQTAAICMWALK